MISTCVVWVFAGLTLVFGVLLALAEGTTARHVWGGLSALCLSGFAFAMVADGLLKGQIRVQFDIVRRATQPVLFWATLVVVALAGVGVLVGSAMAFFVK